MENIQVSFKLVKASLFIETNVAEKEVVGIVVFWDCMLNTSERLLWFIWANIFKL